MVVIAALVARRWVGSDVDDAVADAAVMLEMIGIVTDTGAGALPQPVRWYIQ